MKANYKTFKELQKEKLSDPQRAKSYLETALEELHETNDRESFLLALRDVAEAQGGVSELLGKTDLKPAAVYKALSDKGNPTLSTLDQVLGGLGLRLSVELAN